MGRYALAIGAGVFGAFASVCGKLGAHQSILHDVCVNGGLYMQGNGEICWTISLILRAVFVLLTLALNGVMWSLFIESMQTLATSEAVVLNTGSNILTSALIGKLLFGDKLSVIWWVGATLIVTGMAVLQSKQSKEHQE
ncbi:transmembrane protein 42-like [Ciona intestinalis]